MGEGDCEAVMSDSEEEESRSSRPMLSKGGTASMAASVADVTGPGSRLP